MRISDWSSDVCSSDLRRDWANLPSRLREGVGGGPVTKRKPYTDKASNRPTARSRELRRNMIPAEPRLCSSIRARHIVDTRFKTKFIIGRTSRRERMGQSVIVSVFAHTLKQKKT